ncbi:MAG TPA: glycosyltransferase [Patescibacteria group bacterium]|nr:glycosyltransferase [Patescibacteria group bacterium]
MPERIRLLAFVTVFDVGGTERQLVALARGLDRSRFDLRVACFKRSGVFLPELEAQGIPIINYPIRNLHGLRTMKEQLRFARDLRRERTQILHAFNFYPNMFAIPAARLAGVPAIIATLRDMGDLWTPMQRRTQRWVCRMAHRVVANADAVREQALKEGYEPRKLSVIRNGLDLSKFSGATDPARQREALGLPLHVPVVAVFSRLNHEVKGIHCFLEAAAQVAPAHPDARFLVVGDGPLRADLEALGRRLGLGDRVRFTGFRADIGATMAAVTISVIPSQSEGLSNVLLESMAASLPVVATRVGGTPEVVENHRSGMLVPPRDPAALAQAIGSLLNDPERATALGRAGRRRVERRFQLNRMVDETMNLYEEMILRTGQRTVLAAEHAR